MMDSLIPKVSLNALDSDSGHPLNAQIFQRDLNIDASSPLSNAAPVPMIKDGFGSKT